MFERVLVVCDGNICRSPTVAAMLAALKPEKRVHSAGLVGLEGHAMDATARAVAETNGVVCGEHAGRRLTAALCRDADLILVMDGASACRDPGASQPADPDVAIDLCRATKTQSPRWLVARRVTASSRIWSRSAIGTHRP